MIGFRQFGQHSSTGQAGSSCSGCFGALATMPLVVAWDPTVLLPCHCLQACENFFIFILGRLPLGTGGLRGNTLCLCIGVVLLPGVSVLPNLGLAPLQPLLHTPSSLLVAVWQGLACLWWQSRRAALWQLSTRFCASPWPILSPSSCLAHRFLSPWVDCLASSLHPSVGGFFSLRILRLASVHGRALHRSSNLLR